MSIDKLNAAIEKLDEARIRKLLPALSSLLRENPSFSAQVLSRFLRVLQVTGSMVSRGDERRAELAPYMPLFEELVRNGAAVNCEWPCDDYPPLFVSVQLGHPIFTERLLQLGADSRQIVNEASLDDLVKRDPTTSAEILAVLARHRDPS